MVADQSSKMMMKPGEGIPLIYILSTGRSGSTLLDMLLGSEPDIWTLGEAQILPWEVRENWFPCGCGEHVAECDFWGPLSRRLPLDQGDYPIEYFRERANYGRVIRWPLVYDIFRHKPSRRTFPGIEQYGLINARFFEVIQEAAQERTGNQLRWLVDASKDVYRVFWLQHSGLFDLRIIHLMKDPRAFVYSITRHIPPHTMGKSMRYTGRWLVQNQLCSRYCADPALSGRVYRLQYERLASDPDGTMLALGQWLNTDFSKENYRDFRQHENHAIAGNPMRWQSDDIHLDEKWRSALPKNQARLIWASAGILARSYGYSKDPSASKRGS
jgi:hypothetical protein